MEEADVFLRGGRVEEEVAPVAASGGLSSGLRLRRDLAIFPSTLGAFGVDGTATDDRSEASPLEEDGDLAFSLPLAEGRVFDVLRPDA